MECKKSDNNIKKERLWTHNFSLLFQGQLVSVFGNIIYDTALKLWILTKTGSVSLMAVFTAITIIPEIIVSPFAGTFIDRYDKKIILIITDTISGIGIIFVGLASILGILKIWMVVLIGSIVGLCTCFFNPSIDSIIPELVPKSKLIKANSVFSSMSTANNMIGYAFGGFLIKLLGIPIVFLFNGISFLISAFSEYFIKIHKVEKHSEELTFLEDLRFGIRFIKNFKGLKYLYMVISFLNLCAVMSMTLTLPWFQLNKQLGIVAYGVAMGINTLGMFVGFSFLSVINIKSDKKFMMFILSGVLISSTMIVYSFTMNRIIIYSMFFINGISLAVINSLIQISLQNNVPSKIRGKIFAFKNTISSALMPVGMLIAALLAEKLRINFIVSGDYIVFLIFIIYVLFLPEVKEVINS